MAELIKAFLSGCSYPAFAPFFWGFHTLKSQYNMDNMNKLFGKNSDPYFLYTLTAPVYFGIMSVLTILVSKIFNINFRYAFLITSLISPTLVSIFIKVFDLYTFSEERWIKQYLYLLLFHSFTYNVVIANIYNFLKN